MIPNKCALKCGTSYKRNVRWRVATALLMPVDGGRSLPPGGAGNTGMMAWEGRTPRPLRRPARLPRPGCTGPLCSRRCCRAPCTRSPTSPPCHPTPFPHPRRYDRLPVDCTSRVGCSLMYQGDARCKAAWEAAVGGDKAARPEANPDCSCSAELPRNKRWFGGARWGAVSCGAGAGA